jgi:hypothetical protein
VSWVDFYFFFFLGLLRYHSEDGDVDMEETSTQRTPESDEDELAKYKLDEYDDDEEEEEAGMSRRVPLVRSPTVSDSVPGLFSNIKGLTYYRSNDDDPYITLKEVGHSFTHRLVSRALNDRLHVRMMSKKKNPPFRSNP